MAAYVIANVKEITDPVAFGEYRKLAETSIAKFGGKYVVRGGTSQVVEGNWNPNRLVVLEFPTVERAREWYNSQEYVRARELRFRAARTDVVFVEGV
jgi:uncharacterized protein (DUF1330 family)